MQTTQTPPSPPGKTDRPPGAPAFLQAKATSLSTVDLDWMDTSQITAWFVIERESSNDTVWRVVDSIPGSVTAYHDQGLLCGDTIYYRVYGDNKVGRSFPSNVAHATTPFDSVSTQTIGYHNDLYGVSFIDNSTGFIVGTAGLILKTTNAGATWDSLQSGTTQNLLSVSVNGTTGMVVGWAGIVLRTTDLGVTWVSQASGTSSVLNSVGYLGSKSWIAVGNGGTILRTSDGGNTWLKMISGVGTNLTSVSFANSNMGVIAGGGGTILWTSDGGLDWVKQNSSTAGILYSITMANPTTATAVGDNGIIIHTTNGGLTWAVMSSGVYNWLYAVSFVDSSKGFVAGTYGLLLHTNDGGTTWIQQPLSNIPGQTVLGIYSHPGNDITIVGTFGAILRVFSCI